MAFLATLCKEAQIRHQGCLTLISVVCHDRWQGIRRLRVIIGFVPNLPAYPHDGTSVQIDKEG